MAKIKIDKVLYERAERCAAELGYSSVDELAAHLIERAVREHEAKDAEETEAVEQRLRGLGYIE